MADSFVLPVTDHPDTAPFWIAALENRLTVQRCANCQRYRFPPRPGCGSCGHISSDWTTVSGRGRIWSFAVAHAPTLPAFADLLPLPFAVVELAEDPRVRIPGNIIASPRAALNSLSGDQLAVGLEVAVAFRRIAQDVVLPVWVPHNATDARAG